MMIVMRYDKGHKETTRRHILDAASTRFRRDGIEAVGVAELMGDAGLTHGGFYSHFASKEDLVRATIEHVADGARARFRELMDDGGLEGWIRRYLRPAHRDHPERGCLGATLVSELARHSPTTRAAVGHWTEKVFDDVAAHLPARIPGQDRRAIAVGIFSTMIGALQLARVAPDMKTADETLESGIACALKLAGLKPRQTSLTKAGTS
jgi:TetR/AcrR family transcriptional repressor of nem operon